MDPQLESGRIHTLTPRSANSVRASEVPTKTMLTKIIRLLIGAVLLISGLNKFFGFVPQPPHTAAGTAFMTALVHTSYMMPLIGVVEIVCGVAFVAGRFVPLAAIVFAPVALNIVLFHAVLDPAHGALGFFVGAATIYLLSVNFRSYQDVLRPRDRMRSALPTKGRKKSVASGDAPG